MYVHLYKYIHIYTHIKARYAFSDEDDETEELMHEEDYDVREADGDLETNIKKTQVV
jgi:hypothetical protein